MAKQTTKPLARGSKLTEDVQTKIVQALQLGLYIIEACKIVGITNPTYHNWVKLGRAGKKPYADFLEATEEASAAAEGDALAKIRKGEDNWQASAWFLERRFRQRWARTVDNSGIADTPVQKQLVVRFIKPGEVKADSEKT